MSSSFTPTWHWPRLYLPGERLDGRQGSVVVPHRPATMMIFDYVERHCMLRLPLFRAGYSATSDDSEVAAATGMGDACDSDSARRDASMAVAGEHRPCWR